MPKYRPRIRQSLAYADMWKQNPPPPVTPTGNFTLRYRDVPNPGYVAEWTANGAAQTVALNDLLEPDSTRSLFTEGWRGLMLPDRIDCTVRADAGAARLPQNVDCTESHAHDSWARIDQQGHPAGQTGQGHDHVIRLCQFVLCDYADNNGNVLGTMWYPLHEHPLT